jgi:dipeptidyl-peptidase 4
LELRRIPAAYPFATLRSPDARELTERFPAIDFSRAGIRGHSGGGFATTTAMFRYPDFFKLGIAESGNHD